MGSLRPHDLRRYQRSYVLALTVRSPLGALIPSFDSVMLVCGRAAPSGLYPLRLLREHVARGHAQDYRRLGLAHVCHQHHSHRCHHRQDLVRILSTLFYSTSLSLLTAARDSYIARLSGHLNVYETVLRACIESALVTWIGLLLYEICSLAPNGHVVVRMLICNSASSSSPYPFAFVNT